MTTRQDEYITLLDDCLAEVRRLTDDYAAATHLLADRDAHIERLKAELATLRASAASVQADQRAEIDAANAALDELRQMRNGIAGCAQSQPSALISTRARKVGWLAVLRAGWGKTSLERK